MVLWNPVRFFQVFRPVLLNVISQVNLDGFPWTQCDLVVTDHLQGSGGVHVLTDRGPEGDLQNVSPLLMELPLIVVWTRVSPH